MTRSELILVDYFLETLSQYQGYAGSNDMPVEPFRSIRNHDLVVMLERFDEWDKKANPDGWEPRQFPEIPDFSWLGYIRSLVKNEMNQKQSESGK